MISYLFILKISFYMFYLSIFIPKLCICLECKPFFSSTPTQFLLNQDLTSNLLAYSNETVLCAYRVDKDKDILNYFQDCV